MFKTLLLVLCSSLLLHQTRTQSLPSTFVEGGRSCRHLDQWVLYIYLPACVVAAPRRMPLSDTACKQRRSGLLL